MEKRCEIGQRPNLRPILDKKGAILGKKGAKLGKKGAILGIDLGDYIRMMGKKLLLPTSKE